MARTYNVAVIVGSLRKDSINRKVANALIELAPPSLKLKTINSFIKQIGMQNWNRISGNCAKSLQRAKHRAPNLPKRRKRKRN